MIDTIYNIYGNVYLQEVLTQGTCCYFISGNIFKACLCLEKIQEASGSSEVKTLPACRATEMRGFYP